MKTDREAHAGKKRALTRNVSKLTFSRMPAQPTIRTRAKQATKKVKRKSLAPEQLYGHFFVPSPSPLWRHEEDNFSLEQPSPLKWSPSETTYGIDVNLLLTPNA